jgi:acyl carrier protein
MAQGVTRGVTGGVAGGVASGVASTVTRIIRERLRVTDEEIKPEASFVDDLGADSLSLVEMTLSFEDAFGIDIEDNDVEKIKTVDDAIRYVEERVAARGGTPS